MLIPWTSGQKGHRFLCDKVPKCPIWPNNTADQNNKWHDDTYWYEDI